MTKHRNYNSLLSGRNFFPHKLLQTVRKLTLLQVVSKKREGEYTNSYIQATHRWTCLFTVTGSLPASFKFRTAHSKQVRVLFSPLGYWILKTKYAHSRSHSAIEMSTLSSVMSWPSIDSTMWSYFME